MFKRDSYFVLRSKFKKKIDSKNVISYFCHSWFLRFINIFAIMIIVIPTKFILKDEMFGIHLCCVKNIEIEHEMFQKK